MSGITIDARLRTLVLDPDHGQQAMVQHLLEGDGRFVVVGTFAPSGCSAAAAAAFTPDLILLDPCDGDELDLALVGTLVGSIPRARIVLRTNVFTLGALEAVTALGASGYLIKLSHPIPQLCDALALAGRTGIFVCAQSITNCIRAQLSARALLTRRPESPPSSVLTRREEQVLTLIAGGETDKAIGLELQIQPSTVDSCVARLCHKFGATNRPHLVDAAWRRGLLGRQGTAQREFTLPGE